LTVHPGLLEEREEGTLGENSVRVRRNRLEKDQARVTTERKRKGAVSEGKKETRINQ